MTLEPFTNPVTVELSHYVHLVKRACVRLPNEWTLVSNDIRECIVKAKNWELMVHFEPITQDDLEELVMLGFRAPNESIVNLWRMCDENTWLRVYQHEVSRKQREGESRQRAVEFSAHARKLLAEAKAKLVEKWGYSQEAALAVLNMCVDSQCTSKEFEPLRKMLNLVELVGKIGDVKAYL